MYVSKTAITGCSAAGCEDSWRQERSGPAGSRFKVLRLAAFFLASLFSIGAQADIYAFTDDAGTVHLSDIPDDNRYILVLRDPKTGPADLDSAASNHSAAAASPFHEQIEKAAQAQRLDPGLLHAIIKVESGYDPAAVSKRGAVGLMQLMPRTAKRYGVKDPLDPVQNVNAGARYLRDLLGLFGQDLKLALAAYNAGEQAVLNHGRSIPPYRESLAYVPKVLSVYEPLSEK